MPYRIEEVDGSDPDVAETLRRFNAMAPEIFPPLTEHHLEDGYWWLVYHTELPDPVAFCGYVTFDPFIETAYLKRAYCMMDHVGHGIQLCTLYTRETHARAAGYTRIVTECAEDSHSNLNLRRAGYEMFEPEQKWGAPRSNYWRKAL